MSTLTSRALPERRSAVGLAAPLVVRYPMAMTNNAWWIAGLLALWTTAASAAEPTEALSFATFAQELEGAWEATTPAGKRIVVTYSLVSGGTTLMERYGESPRASLTTYHADGESLLLTHYCPQGNQPRLRARAMKGNTLAFAFVDTTNKQADQSMLRALTYRYERAAPAGPSSKTGPTTSPKTSHAPSSLHTLVRTETYVGPDGKDDVTTLRFTRVRSETKR